MKKRIYRMLTAIMLLALLLPAMAEVYTVTEEEAAPAELQPFELGGEDEATIIPETQEDVVEAEDEVVMEATEEASQPQEVAFDLAEADGRPVPQALDMTVPATTKSAAKTINNIDTLKITIEGAKITKVSGTQKLVTYTYDANAVTVKGVADKAGKATLTIKLDNKKSVKVTITVEDPYQVTWLSFDEKKRDLAPGKSLDLKDMLVVEPAFAMDKLQWKISGKAATLKDGVVTAGTKKGTSTVTVTYNGKKKKTATIKITIPDNKVKSLHAKPAKADTANVKGGWTLWPYSIEYTSKGTLKAQFYLLNGTEEKSVRIENLKLTVSGADKVAAEYTFNTVKVSASKNSVKSFNVEFPASSLKETVFLPEEHQNGTLYFDINVDETKLITKVKKTETSYSYITDVLPNYPGADEGEEEAVGDFVIKNGTVLRYTGAEKTLAIPPQDASGNPVTAIGDSAFKDYTDLTSVTLPATITQIGAHAFEGCTSLETVNMPKGVSAVGQAAFKGCGKLTGLKPF